MKLSALAAKPVLIKITLDDEILTAKYSGGEPLEFWTWDRQPIDTFMKLAAIDTNNNQLMIDVVKTMILDEDGKPVITDDVVLPGPVMIQAIGKIVETLGKQQAGPLTGRVEMS